jgi:uncharacterized DUF497 family protein
MRENEMEFSGFDWDQGNRSKCQKHGVSPSAIEGLFAGPVAILPDVEHSESEHRFRAIGRTKQGRAVFVVFTLRRGDDGLLIRPISARYMHDKEVQSYESQNPNLPK